MNEQKEESLSFLILLIFKTKEIKININKWLVTKVRMLAFNKKNNCNLKHNHTQAMLLVLLTPL